MEGNALLNNLFSLENQRGILTGGSSGLGLAMAELLAGAGAEVHVLSRTGKTKDNSQSHSNIVHHAVDIMDKEALEAIVKKVAKDGLDFLINNAGITEKETAVDVTSDTWEKIQDVNVTAMFRLSQLCFSYLSKAPLAGRIVNVASMAAHLGFSYVVPYCTSKSAVTGLTRGLCVEWANDNILVNSVSPGWFPSEMNKQVLDKERQKKILGRMPLHRYGKPSELANMVLFLVSPAASYITGQDFAVDGGALAFGF